MNRRRFDGFTLVEIVVSLTLLAVVGGTIGVALTAQWRQHDAIAQSEGVNHALIAGADLLLSELRSVSPAAGDIVYVSDSAVEVHGTLGASVVCSTSVLGDRVFLAPHRPQSGSSLTWWRDAPTVGDSVEVLDGRGPARDSISRHVITTIGSGSCPIASGFTKNAADAALGIGLTVAPPVAPTVSPGSPARFLRPTRYSLYRSSSDNRWYLGVREFVNGGWTGVQPVTGPYDARTAAAPVFIVRDSAGASLTSPSPLGSAQRFDFALRGGSWLRGRAMGRASTATESLLVALAPRNR